MARGRSDSTSKKKKVAKQETVTKTPKKEKDARPKEAGSKGRKTEKSREVNTPQHKKGSAARRRKSSSAEPTAGELMIFCQSETSFSYWGNIEKNVKQKCNRLIVLVAGPQRRSGRVTRQNGK